MFLGTCSVCHLARAPLQAVAVAMAVAVVVAVVVAVADI